MIVTRTPHANNSYVYHTDGSGRVIGRTKLDTVLVALMPENHPDLWFCGRNPIVLPDNADRVREYQQLGVSLQEAQVSVAIAHTLSHKGYTWVYLNPDMTVSAKQTDPDLSGLVAEYNGTSMTLQTFMRKLNNMCKVYWDDFNTAHAAFSAQALPL